MQKHWIVSARVIFRQKVDPKTQKPATNEFGDEIPSKEENLGPQLVVGENANEAIVEYDAVQTANYRRRIGAEDRDILAVDHFVCAMEGPYRIEEQPVKVSGPAATK